jgi:glycerophosphoryl diester phosphodiesterase
MLIFAHRGASDARLENTLPAFLHALERGADGVELDVQLTRDGEVIVFHDADLLRLAGRHERVENLSWDELSQVVLLRGGKIPRLSDLLAVWPTDRWLNVELKAGGAAIGREAVRVLEGRPRVLLSSFDPRMLLAARAAGSAYEHALLLAAESPPFLQRGAGVRLRRERGAGVRCTRCTSIIACARWRRCSVIKRRGCR